MDRIDPLSDDRLMTMSARAGVLYGSRRPAEAEVSAEPLSIEDNHAERRYEIRIDDVVAGHIDYDLREDMIVLKETVVEPQFRGQGVGSRLVAATLADAERRGLRILPRCSFVRDFIRRQPEPSSVLTS